MTLTWGAASIADDYLVVDTDNTTITFFSRATETTFNPDVGESVSNVLRADVDKEYLQSRGLESTQGVMWHIWNSTITAVPKVQDVIRDGAGQRWAVKEVGINSLGTRYECLTILEVS